MDFDNLPEVAFLRIFDYLPLKDRFRVGRVSQSFRQISQIVNGRIKSLKLDDYKFSSEPAGVDQFEVVLRLCQHNLREITFLWGSHPSLVSKLSEFTFPQLVDLDLGQVAITHDVFALLVTNHPNLKRLQWWPIYQSEDEIFTTLAQFPPMIMTNLETLKIRTMNDAALERLIDRCPNLKRLDMLLIGASSLDIWDRFLQSVPRLESLGLNLVKSRIRMENLVWLWRLPLLSLTIFQTELTDDEFLFNDDFVYKVVEHFTNIEHLRLSLIKASDNVKAVLARLEKLRVFSMCVRNTEFTDQLISKFSACRDLEELAVGDHVNLSDQTFLDLFRKCSRLRKLLICGVVDGDGVAIDAQTASMLLLELANVPHRPTITIRLPCTTNQQRLDLVAVWKSIQVQNAMQYLKENRGMEIDILVYRRR